jgi:hypothetical protein
MLVSLIIVVSTTVARAFCHNDATSRSQGLKEER